MSQYGTLQKEVLQLNILKIEHLKFKKCNASTYINYQHEA